MSDSNVFPRRTALKAGLAAGLTGLPLPALSDASVHLRVGPAFARGYLAIAVPESLQPERADLLGLEALECLGGPRDAVEADCLLLR